MRSGFSSFTRPRPSPSSTLTNRPTAAASLVRSSGQGRREGSGSTAGFLLTDSSQFGEPRCVFVLIKIENDVASKRKEICIIRILSNRFLDRMIFILLCNCVLFLSLTTVNSVTRRISAQSMRRSSHPRRDEYRTVRNADGQQDVSAEKGCIFYFFSFYNKRLERVHQSNSCLAANIVLEKDISKSQHIHIQFIIIYFVVVLDQKKITYNES